MFKDNINYYFCYSNSDGNKGTLKRPYVLFQDTSKLIFTKT